MARGKKYPPAVREKALALLATNDNVIEVAKEMGLPEGTVRTWALQAVDDDDFNELRTRKKQEFINNAWAAIEKGLKLAIRRVATAHDKEKEINRIIEELQGDTKLSEKNKKTLINKLKSLQVHNLRDLSTFIGTLYDKQALASGEATNRLETTLTIEQLLRELKTIDAE